MRLGALMTCGREFEARIRNSSWIPAYNGSVLVFGNWKTLFLADMIIVRRDSGWKRIIKLNLFLSRALF